MCEHTKEDIVKSTSAKSIFSIQFVTQPQLESNMLNKTTYSKVACVGTGVSGIGLGASLKRWYGETDIKFFERSNHPCGTWNINRYPGMMKF